MKTIKKNFNILDLPAWARKNPSIVRAAEANLSFRCDVASAKTKTLREILTRVAEREYVIFTQKTK